MSITTIHCERCGHNVEAHASIFSGLGPSRRRCSKCGKSYRNDRREWPDLRPWRRGWYIIYSVAAALGVGGLTWIMAAASFGAARELSGTLDLPKYWIIGTLMGVLWGVLVLLLQLYRVLCSMRRFEEGSGVYDGPMGNLQVDVGLKVIAAVFASMLLAALLGLICRL